MKKITHYFFNHIIKILIFIPLIFLCNNIIYAQEAGIISGTVVDSVTNEPLPGSNIILRGTTLGTATDSTGYKIF